MKLKPIEILVLALCLTGAMFGQEVKWEHPVKVEPGKDADRTKALLLKISPMEGWQCPTLNLYVMPVAPKDFKGPAEDAFPGHLLAVHKPDGNPQHGLQVEQSGGAAYKAYCLQVK